MTPRNLPRNGRPPRVEKRDGTFYVRVRGEELAFRVGTKDLVRVDRNKGVDPRDVSYGKQVVTRAIAAGVA